MSIKTVITVLFALFIFNFAFSQKIFPTLEDNPVWNVQQSIEPFMPGPVYMLKYRFDKDTIIGNRTFTFVSRTGYQGNNMLSEFVGLIRTEAKKVLFKKSVTGKEYLMYDFDLNVGNKVVCPFYNLDSTEYTVINIDSISLNGKKRLRLEMLPTPIADYPFPLSWIEGIGNLVNPFYHDVYGRAGVTDEVRCFSTNQGQLYINPEYDDCTTVLRKTEYLVNEGITWSVMNIYKDQSGRDSVSSHYVKFEGDTLLNGRTYYKVWQSYDSLAVNWNLTGLIREVEKRVYYHELGYDGPVDMLLYDFSLKKGDSQLLASIETSLVYIPVKVSGIDSLIIEGEKKLRLHVSSGNINDSWIQKIGSLQGVVNRSYILTDNHGILLCVQENGKTIYSNKDYSDCFYTQYKYTSIKQHFLSDDIMIYPNPVIDNLYIEINNQKVSKPHVKILDMHGQVVCNKTVPDLNNKIDVSRFPPGLYIVRIVSEDLILNKKIVKQ